MMMLLTDKKIDLTKYHQPQMLYLVPGLFSKECDMTKFVNALQIVS